jgi:hypothetical protein
MKNSLVTLGLMAWTAAASAAEWVAVAKNDKGTVLIDKSSVRQSGSSEKTVWVLFNFNEPSFGEIGLGKHYRSYTSLRTISCSEKTIMIKSTSFYSGTNGNGESVGSTHYANAQPQYVVPESTGETTWNAVCDPK